MKRTWRWWLIQIGVDRQTERLWITNETREQTAWFIKQSHQHSASMPVHIVLHYYFHRKEKTLEMTSQEEGISPIVSGCHDRSGHSFFNIVKMLAYNKTEKVWCWADHIAYRILYTRGGIKLMSRNRRFCRKDYLKNPIPTAIEFCLTEKIN